MKFWKSIYLDTLKVNQLNLNNPSNNLYRWDAMYSSIFRFFI